VSDFSNPRRSGIISINLAKGDKLIRAQHTLGTEEVVIATAKGKAIRFAQGEVRCMGRSGRGVRGIQLSEEDKVVSLALMEKQESALLTVCERGYGKRTFFKSYRSQSRGGKGITSAVVTERNGLVVAALAIKDDDELIIMAQSGMSIREAAKEIKLSGRSTQGVRLIKLKSADKVAAVAKVVKEEE
jgi:DNA gyrase subunit A